MRKIRNIMVFVLLLIGLAGCGGDQNLTVPCRSELAGHVITDPATLQIGRTMIGGVPFPGLPIGISGNCTFTKGAVANKYAVGDVAYEVTFSGEGRTFVATLYIIP